MLAQNQVLNQGRYRIIHQFENTDSAGLYEAYDTVSNTNVVLRESSGGVGQGATPGQIETLKITFADQAKRLADIQHDALLGVRDYFSETGRQYLVMESFDGQGLTDFINVDDSPAISDVIKWTDQLLDALDYLHSRTPAVIHQNINPHNIRLTSEFKIKLLVAGSDSIDEHRTHHETSDATINYRALEQLWLGLDSASQNVIANSFDESSESILRQPADPATDIYALSATVYHLVTGTAPADPLARTIDILDGNEDPLSAPHFLNPKVPAELSGLLMKGLEIRRENRFATASEMRQELKAASLNVPVIARPHRHESELASESESHEAFRREPRDAFAAENAQEINLSDTSSPFDELKLALAGDDLLDLPPVAAKHHAPLSGRDVLSLDADPVTSDEMEITLGGMFETSEKRSGVLGRPALIFAAVAVLAVAAVGGWMFIGAAPQAQPAATAPTTLPVQEPSLEIPVNPTAAPPEVAPEPASGEAGTSSADVPASVHSAEVKTDATAAKPKTKSPAKAEVKPAPTKKKVTVDDLITDN